MKTQLITAAALLAASLAVSPAMAHWDVDHAVWACEAVNNYQPAHAYDAYYNGDYYDDYTVMIRDRDGDAWRCIADGYGNIYDNILSA